jgi:hypothetical protein
MVVAGALEEHLLLLLLLLQQCSINDHKAGCNDRCI